MVDNFWLYGSRYGFWFEGDKMKNFTICKFQTTICDLTSHKPQEKLNHFRLISFRKNEVEISFNAEVFNIHNG